MGYRLRQLRRAAKLRQQDLVEQYGFPSQDAVTRFERGLAGSITHEFLQALICFVHARSETLDWLIAGAAGPGTATAPPLEWLEQATPEQILAEYGRLSLAAEQVRAFAEVRHDPRRRRLIIRGLRASERCPWDRHPQRVDVEDLLPDWRGKYVPIVAGVAAGEGSDTVEAEQEAMEYVACEGAPDGAFAVEVFGECMMPDYQPGDVVVADPRRLVDCGPAVILYRSESGERLAQLRILRRDGGRIRLESRRRRPIEIPADRLIAAYAVWKHLPARGDAGHGATQGAEEQGA